MPNLTLAKEGTSFFGEGVRLSWPKGGGRPVVPSPPELSLRIRQRIAEGYIVQTDDAPNRPAYTPPVSRILDPSVVRQRREQRQAPGEVVVEPEAVVVEPEEPVGADSAESETMTAVAELPEPVTTRRTPTRRKPGRRKRPVRGG